MFSEGREKVRWEQMETWPLIGPNFNFHHRRKISTGLKMALQTPKSGVYDHFCMLKNSV